MYSQRIGDGNGKEYVVKVMNTRLVTVDEIDGNRERSILSTITVTPKASFFPPAVGARIVEAIAEGRKVLGQVAP